MKIVGRQNKRLKRDCDRYKARLTEIHLKGRSDEEQQGSCPTCARMYLKRDEFWDNEDVCICGKDNHYIGYPDEAVGETCPSYETAVDIGTGSLKTKAEEKEYIWKRLYQCF